MSQTFLHLLIQNNETVQQWSDGAPYAFQAWEQPFNLSAKLNAYLLENKTYPLVKGNNILYIQPVSDPTHACTAAVYNPTAIMTWIKIPCTTVHSGSSYVCEIRIPYKKTNGTTFIHWLKQHLSVAYECPIRTFKLLDSCIGFYTTG